MFITTGKTAFVSWLFLELGYCFCVVVENSLKNTS